MSDLPPVIRRLLEPLTRSQKAHMEEEAADFDAAPSHDIGPLVSVPPMARGFERIRMPPRRHAARMRRRLRQGRVA